MNTAIAFHLLEKGEACCLYASVLIMRSGGKVWISFDGKEWEETESEIIKKQV